MVKKVSIISLQIFSILKRIFRIFLLVYFGLGIILFTFQKNYIYYPDKTDFRNCTYSKNVESVSFGLTRGYYTKRSADNIIIYYHGNAGRACDRYYLFDALFAEKDYSTLFVEYSGYAEKEGELSMSKILENTSDTMQFLKDKNLKNIIVIGESLGNGPAAYHALHGEVSKLILITAYNNLADVSSAHYPVYPMRLMLLSNFTPAEWLSSYKGPVSVILAENDEAIPVKLGKKLYEGIPSDYKELHIVKNAGHNTIYEKDEFYSILKEAL
jgi:esterase/lipase